MKYDPIYTWFRSSPDAVKETVDTLPIGLCFFDPAGRVTLCNRTMGELSITLIGSYPQTSGELKKAIEALGPDSEIRLIQENPLLYQFPDDRIWQFLIEDIQEGYRLVSAFDVTRTHEINDSIRKENEKLESVQTELQQLLRTLPDRVREKEVLELKMRIHDNIGSSLLAISNIIQHPESGSLEEQLSILEDAVSYLSDDRTTETDTFEEAMQKASAIHVSLILQGSLPENQETESLIAAAAKECASNCVRHAGGDEVIVRTSEHDGITHVVITNNGLPPEKEIKEGSGLSNLRGRVEAFGGEMTISSRPVFALTLDLPNDPRPF